MKFFEKRLEKDTFESEISDALKELRQRQQQLEVSWVRGHSGTYGDHLPSVRKVTQVLRSGLRLG